MGKANVSRLPSCGFWPSASGERLPTSQNRESRQRPARNKRAENRFCPPPRNTLEQKPHHQKRKQIKRMNPSQAPSTQPAKHQGRPPGGGPPGRQKKPPQRPDTQQLPHDKMWHEKTGLEGVRFHRFATSPPPAADRWTQARLKGKKTRPTTTGTAHGDATLRNPLPVGFSWVRAPGATR